MISCHQTFCFSWFPQIVILWIIIDYTLWHCGAWASQQSAATMAQPVKRVWGWTVYKSVDSVHKLYRMKYLLFELIQLSLLKKATYWFIDTVKASIFLTKLDMWLKIGLKLRQEFNQAAYSLSMQRIWPMLDCTVVYSK